MSARTIIVCASHDETEAGETEVDDSPLLLRLPHELLSRILLRACTAGGGSASPRPLASAAAACTDLRAVVASSECWRNISLSLLEPGSLPRGRWESGCGSSDARASLRATLEMRRPQWEEVETAKLPRPSYGHTVCVSEGEPSALRRMAARASSEWWLTFFGGRQAAPVRRRGQRAALQRTTHLRPLPAAAQHPEPSRSRLGARLVTASLRGLARRQPRTWTRHAPSAAAAVPPARRLHTAVLCGGRMYVLGGSCHVPNEPQVIVNLIPYSMAWSYPSLDAPLEQEGAVFSDHWSLDLASTTNGGRRSQYYDDDDEEEENDRPRRRTAGGGAAGS